MSDTQPTVNDTQVPIGAPSPTAAPISPGTPPIEGVPEAILMGRDDARTAIFGMQPLVVPANLNGVKVEIRQPSIDHVISFQQSSGDDRKEVIAHLFINYIFIPGGDPVFELGDVPTILQMPWNRDVLNIQNKILALMGVAPDTEDKSTAA